MQSQGNVAYTEAVYSAGDRFCPKTYCYAAKPMTTIPTQKQLIKKLIGIWFGFTLAISAGYIWAIPAVYKNYKTYNLLIIGVIGAAAWAGYETYRDLGAESKKTKRITFSILFGVAIASLVLFASLLAIVNIKGS